MDSGNLKTQPRLDLSVANYFKTAPNRSSWGPRVITDFEFIYIAMGRGYYKETEDSILTVSQNETLLIPPGIEHSFFCDTREATTISCIHFSFEPAPIGFQATVYPGTTDAETHNLFRKSALEFTRKDLFAKEILNCLISEIWHRLVRAQLQSGFASKEPAKLSHAKQYMERSFRNPISRKEVAQYLDITPEHLNYLFKHHETVTPVEYLTRLRLRAAKELLLAADQNISEVAYQTGFNDPLYFSRIFKREFGIPPRQFAKGL